MSIKTKPESKTQTKKEKKEVKATEKKKLSRKYVVNLTYEGPITGKGKNAAIGNFLKLIEAGKIEPRAYISKLKAKKNGKSK